MRREVNQRLRFRKPSAERMDEPKPFYRATARQAQPFGSVRNYRSESLNELTDQKHVIRNNFVSELDFELFQSVMR